MFHGARPSDWVAGMLRLADLRTTNRYEKQEFNHPHTRRAVRPVNARLTHDGMAVDGLRAGSALFLIFDI